MSEDGTENWTAPPGIGLGRILREGELAFSRIFRRALAEYDVTVAQYQHLRELWEGDGVSQTELSRRVRVEDASSTATLDALGRRGLIRRERDEADRRRMKVFLEPSGRALRDDLIDCARRTNEAATAGLSRAELETMFLALNRIIVNLRQAETEGSVPEAGRPAAAAVAGRSR